MRRLERFSHYTFNDWPDEALLGIAAGFVCPVISRLELSLRGRPTLVLELVDESVPDTLRLTFEGTIYALESYDEFYSQPYGKSYWKNPQTRQSIFLEVQGEPDAWVLKLLADNPDQAVFPPHSGATFDVLVGIFSDTPTGQELESARQAALEHQATLERNHRARQPYYHLFIASDSVMVEILCEADLLTGELCGWNWVKRE